MTLEDLVTVVRSMIARELDVEVESLDDSQSLRQFYGLDSVAAVNIVFGLEELLGRTLDVRDFADLDSINAIRTHLGKHHQQ